MKLEDVSQVREKYQDNTVWVLTNTVYNDNSIIPPPSFMLVRSCMADIATSHILGNYVMFFTSADLVVKERTR